MKRGKQIGLSKWKKRRERQDREGIPRDRSRPEIGLRHKARYKALQAAQSQKKTDPDS